MHSTENTTNVVVTSYTSVCHLNDVYMVVRVAFCYKFMLTQVKVKDLRIERSLSSWVLPCSGTCLSRFKFLT